MTLLFEVRFVFGLFVLCVFHSVFVEAKFKIKLPSFPPPSSSSSSLSALPHQVSSGAYQTPQNLESHRLRPAFLSVPSLTTLSSMSNRPVSSGIYRTPQNLDTNRLRPAFASLTPPSSMSNLYLPPSSSSSSTIHRSASSPSLNTANSPSIMREITHTQAAAALNVIRPPVLHLRQNPSLSQRLMPNMDSIKLAAKYLREGAIAAAGTGGVVVVAEAINGNKCCEDRKEEKNITNKTSIVNDTNIISTTTSSPEYYNRVGTNV